MQAHGTEGGDSLGISEYLETLQERSFGRRSEATGVKATRRLIRRPPESAEATEKL